MATEQKEENTLPDYYKIIEGENTLRERAKAELEQRLNVYEAEHEVKHREYAIVHNGTTWVYSVLLCCEARPEVQYSAPYDPYRNVKKGA